jgi:hypothetical protein
MARFEAAGAMEPKQAIVMRRGKEIAQGAHSSMIWLALRIRQPGDTFSEAERPIDGLLRRVLN